MTATAEKPAGIRAEIGAAGIAYDTAGEGDPPLLFLHGWCGDRSFFAPQFEHFSATHRVVSVDLPGHGESKAPAAYSIESLGADVAAGGGPRRR
jgi:pimeloyl-ACP methyl ester carboxylesterase